MLLSLAFFIGGLILIVYFSERLVEGTVGLSLSFGISAFLISVIFIGFDPENLSLGSVSSYEQAAGLALGTIFGALMVAIALAFGITALITPLKFEKAPAEVIVVPGLSVLLTAVLSYDGLLSRLDGALLLTGYVIAIFYLIYLSRKGLTITAEGEVAEVLEEEEEPSKWKAAGLFVVSLAAIILGSEMLVAGSRDLITTIGISETVFGMTILALLVSIEELARELPAALKGREDITYGNVSGSVMAFLLFNAGIIALIRPIPIADTLLYFHIPVCVLTIFFISMCMIQKRVPRWAGFLLVLIYAIFFAGSYFI